MSAVRTVSKGALKTELAKVAKLATYARSRGDYAEARELIEQARELAKAHLRAA